jgi:hypothetical protein
VTGAYGHQDLDVSKDYDTWNLGASIAVMPKLSLDVRYWDTSEHDIGSIYDSRFAATLKASF